MKVKYNKGFTLVELIVVIAILAALALLALPTMSGLIDSARKRTDVSNAKMIYNAAIATIAQESPGTSTHYNSSSYAYKNNTRISFYQHNTTVKSVTDGNGHGYNFVIAVRINCSGKKPTFNSNSECYTFKDAFVENLGEAVKVSYSNPSKGPFNEFYLGYNRANKDQIEVWVGNGTTPKCKLYPLDGMDSDYK